MGGAFACGEAVCFSGVRSARRVPEGGGETVGRGGWGGRVARGVLVVLVGLLLVVCRRVCARACGNSAVNHRTGSGVATEWDRTSTLHVLLGTVVEGMYE